MAISNLGITMTFTDRCPVCNRVVQFGAVGTRAIPETHVPGLEDDGDPHRFLVFHVECEPDYVRGYHEWLSV